MHELSIAISLVELACEKASALGDVKVEALHLRLGALSGVAREALLFSFEVAALGTAVEGARLEIEDVPLTALCPQCDAARPLADILDRWCPVCGGLTGKLVGGQELELAALEVTEPCSHE